MSFIIGTGFRENEFQKQGFILKEICLDYLSSNYEGKNHPKIFIWLFKNYYYYSNDKYYFPHRKDSTKIKLELEHVFEIIDFPNNGLLVFNTDSTFYYLPKHSEKIHGPHTIKNCLLYTSPSPRDKRQSRMPSSA